MKSEILYEFNNNYNNSNEKELHNKEQLIINWINTIKEPHCLLINKLDDKYVSNGTVFFEILKIFIKKFSLYKYKLDDQLHNINSFKLLCTLLIKIEKENNIIRSLYYFYNYGDIIYKDRNILINFFLLLKQLYEKYIINQDKTYNINNSDEKEKIINKNETIDLRKYNTLLKMNKTIKNQKRSRNYINNNNNNSDFFCFNSLSNPDSNIKEQITQRNKTMENNNHFRKKSFNNHFNIYDIHKNNNNNIYSSNTKTKYSSFYDKYNINSPTKNDVKKNLYLTEYLSSDKKKNGKFANNEIKKRDLLLNNNDENKKYNFHIIFKTITFGNRIHRKDRIGVNQKNKYMIYLNNVRFFDSKKNELNMNNTPLFNESKDDNMYNNNTSDSKLLNKNKNKKKNKYLNLTNIKQNFTGIKKFNINDKNKKIREMINWINKINKYSLILDEITLINKVSKGVVLLNILSSIKILLGEKKIQNIINYPSNMLQVKHNFLLFWKEINNYPDMKLILMKYKNREIEIINKNENVIFEILYELYNYYNKVNCYKKQNEKKLKKISSAYDNIVKKINKYSKYKFYDILKYDVTKSGYNNNFISINCQKDCSVINNGSDCKKMNKRNLTFDNISSNEIIKT